MDIFEDKSVSPMLIALEQPAFDDPAYLFELKLDGVRCLAYLGDDTQLRNKRNLNHSTKFPELANLHKQVKCKCILDGELFVYHQKEVDFFEIQRRTLMNDPFKIRLAANALPASFTAFDILYYKDHSVMDEPLMKRKKLLERVVKENERLQLSRYIEDYGSKLFQLTSEQNLEGIVAKRKDSLYSSGARSKDWIKCKNLCEDDFVVCGYIVKEKGVISLLIAQYDQNELCYMGHVSMGASLHFLKEYRITKCESPFKTIPAGNENAIFFKPMLVAIVKYMMKTDQGSLRQPVFKGFRDDKDINECQKKG